MGHSSRGVGLPSGGNILIVAELAKKLRINRKTAYTRIAAGEIPGATKVGRAIRISLPVIEAWLAGEVRASARKRGA
jgi:excisionase family DNA binding protein